MFTGIVEEVGRVVMAAPGRLVVGAGPVLHGVKLGDSMAVNGVCLTVTALDKSSFSADLMAETATRSNLGHVRVGEKVNLERPLALNGWVGGHLVQGHVDATGKLAAMTPEGDAVLMRFEAPADVMYYVVQKGFITVDGISLTVTQRGETSFGVSIVDFTRRHTNLGERKVGDMVNLEVDIIAKYVAQFAQTKRPGITMDFLREHDFGVN